MRSASRIRLSGTRLQRSLNLSGSPLRPFRLRLMLVRKTARERLQLR